MSSVMGSESGCLGEGITGSGLQARNDHCNCLVKSRKVRCGLEESPVEKMHLPGRDGGLDWGDDSGESAGTGFRQVLQGC